jgi:hypothetical protein
MRALGKKDQTQTRALPKRRRNKTALQNAGYASLELLTCDG